METPPSVRVVDEHGNVVADALVRFSVKQGEGAASPSDVVSNAEGIAALKSWRLGEPGPNEVLAQVVGAKAASVAFKATAMGLPRPKTTVDGGSAR